MAFPATGVIDAFSRVDAGDLGADYAKGFNFAGAGARLQVITGQAGKASAYGEDIYTAESFGPDVEAFVTLATLPATGGDCGLSCRYTGSGATSRGYRVSVFKLSGGDEVKVSKVTGGSTSVQVGSTAVQEFAAGDKLGMEVTGSAPTTIRVYRQASGSGTWDLISTVEDSSSPITGAGNIGLYGFSSTAFRLDDFGGGTSTSGSVGGEGSIVGAGSLSGAGDTPAVAPAEGAGSIAGFGGVAGIGEAPAIAPTEGLGQVDGIGALAGLGAAPVVPVAEGVGAILAVGAPAGVGAAPAIAPAQGYGSIVVLGDLDGVGALPAPTVPQGAGTLVATGLLAGEGFAAPVFHAPQAVFAMATDGEVYFTGQFGPARKRA